MPALYGGIVMGLISGIPFINLINCFCCAGILLGGYLSVFFYKKDLPENILLTNKDSLQLGALAGVFGAVISLVLSVLTIYTIGNISGEAMYDFVYGMYDRFGIIEQMTQEQIDQLASMKAAEFDPMNILFAFIIDPLFGLLGGLIGYSLLKPKLGTKTAVPPPVG